MVHQAAVLLKYGIYFILFYFDILVLANSKKRTVEGESQAVASRSSRLGGEFKIYTCRRQVSPEVETYWVAETDEKEKRVKAEGEDKREGSWEMRHCIGTRGRQQKLESAEGD